ncbi:MAG TPA: hypothetical protein VFV79_00065 [Saprospiraceae bacterium]|nr:hypothetical protein [Saprospiraceae bacterium]
MPECKHSGIFVWFDYPFLESTKAGIEEYLLWGYGILMHEYAVITT